MHSKLGSFIRAHRERISPVDVGLTGGGRRRTPGLRREELAHLCNVSPTWLTWLEQGRPVSASAKTLQKVADVLQLTPAERAYLFKLADKLDPHIKTPIEAPVTEFQSIADAVKTPAYILDRQWNAIAWNLQAERLFVGWLDRESMVMPSRNLLRFIFFKPSARTLIVSWKARASRIVAEFRAECGKYADHTPFKELIDELSAQSEDFRQLWNSHNVIDREGGERRFMNTQNEQSVYEQVTFTLASRSDLKLIILLPGGQAS